MWVWHYKGGCYNEEAIFEIHFSSAKISFERINWDMRLFNPVEICLANHVLVSSPCFSKVFLKSILLVGCTLLSSAYLLGLRTVGPVGWHHLTRCPSWGLHAVGSLASTWLIVIGPVLQEHWSESPIRYLWNRRGPHPVVPASESEDGNLLCPCQLMSTGIFTSIRC
jgi:hypothetical protein